MLKIFIFFYILGAVHSDSEEVNEKYIDLLPEAEKQEFLNRIARRILEGIQSDDTPNDSHVEITDDQLDQHHAFVQDIINQETENLRNQESKEARRTNENNYVDMSSSGGKREKRKNHENVDETTPVTMYNVIPVKTVYEDYDTMSKPKVYNASPTSNNEENEEVKKNNDNEENEELHSAGNVESENSKLNSKNLKDEDELSNIKTTDTIDFELHTNDNTTSDNADYEITTVSTVKHINSSHSDKIKRKSNQKLNSTVLEENAKEETFINKITLTTDKITALHTPEAETRNIDKVKEVDLTVLTTDKTLTSSSKTNDETTFRRSGSDSDEALKDTDTEDSSQTSTIFSISHIPVGVKTTQAYLNENQNIYSSSTQNIIEKYSKVQNLRDGIVSSEAESDIPKVNIVISPKKEYEVYEVAPGKTPFVVTKNLTGSKGSGPKSDEPYQQNYVPVYNYAPENAYFKPNIRHGHNTIENDNVKHTNVQKNKVSDLVVKNGEFGNNLRERMISSKEDEEEKKLSTANVEYGIAPKNSPLIIDKKLRGQKSDEPNPNHVPIYNFAPENAYFKPIVRFGPNINEKDNIEDKENIKEFNLAAANRFFGNNKKYPLPQSRIYAKEQLYPQHSIFKPKVVKPTNIYYNPYDYLDMEYDTGRFKRLNLNNLRSVDRFPNSDDEDHPMNSIHKSDTIKDHIRAVRNLMYHQNIFGPLDEVQRKSDHTNFHIQITPVKYPEPNNIAVDYYFERKDSEDDFVDSIDASQRSQNEMNQEEKSTDNSRMKDDKTKKKFKKFYKSMTTVLGDIIRFDNNALKQYDWLATTVELQISIRTLLSILNKIKHGDQVHSNHMEMFKYALYLYKISKTEVEELEEDGEKREEPILFYKGDRKRSALPHNNKKRRIKRPLQLWKDYVHYLRNERYIKIINKFSIFYEFEEFLESLLDHLYNLHEAIKNIATITTYKKQNWYFDLKHIYLNRATKRDIGEVILHLSLIHLLHDVEDSRSIIEESYKRYIRNYKNEVQKAKEDFVFVLLVLEELNRR